LNYSDTVLHLFEQAVDEIGLPSRIRTDHGGENVLIWELMETRRGLNRGSALRGTSTQNGILNTEIYFTLCFSAKNKSIQLFTNSWNHHPLRTERNKSPIQIWQNSMLDILDYNTEFC